MRERVSFLESEIGGLKEQLSAYDPIVSSLKEEFASLERISILWTNRNSSVGKRAQKVAFCFNLILCACVLLTLPFFFLHNQLRNLHMFSTYTCIYRECLFRM
jgi:hypothetical protein